MVRRTRTPTLEQYPIFSSCLFLLKNEITSVILKKLITLKLTMDLIYKHRCHENYRNLLSENTLPNDKQAELEIALKRDMVIWEDLEPCAFEKYKLPHMIDYGIDAVSLDCTSSSQVKLYNDKSRITWTDFCKFSTLSDMLSIESSKRFLDTTEQARLCSYVKAALNSGLAILERHSELSNMVLSRTQSPATGARQQCHAPPGSQIRKRLPDLRSHQCEAIQVVKEKDPRTVIRIQMPPGSGKTRIALELFSYYLNQNPGTVHLFLSPGISLSKQIECDVQHFGIPVRFIGESHDTGVPNGFQDGYVIVCVFASVHKLPKFEYGLKVIDEAHHVENDGPRQKDIHEVECERTLMMSATLRDQEQIDYSLSLQEAIDANYILDYKFHFGVHQGSVMMETERVDAAVNLVCRHVDMWSPIFVYFNTTKNLHDAAELFRERGISAAAIDGETKSSDRSEIRQSVEHGALDVVCLCGVWNEGISIDQVRTVVFAEPRYSIENKIQVASRANRPCSDKAFYRVVFSCCESDMEDGNVQELIRGFANIDSRLATSIRHKDTTRICVEILQDDNGNVEQDRADTEESDVELAYEQIYDRLGRMMPDDTWELRFRALRAYKETNGDLLVPKSFKFSDDYPDVTLRGFKLGNSVSNIRGRNIKISDEQRKILDSLGFVWDVRAYERDRLMNALKTYKETHGDLLVPLSFKFPPDYPDVTLRDFTLGQSINSIRSGNISLSDDEKQNLNSMGFVWDVRAYERDRLMNALKAYKETHGDLLVSQNFKFPTDYRDITLRGFKLGKSINRIRSGNISLSDDEKQNLNSMVLIWDLRAYERDRLMNALKAYKETHGDLLVSHSFKFPPDYPDVMLQGFKLGESVGSIRTGNISLSDDEKQILVSQGFVWELRAYERDRLMDALKAYKETHGDLLIPIGFKFPPDYPNVTLQGFKLGRSVSRIRSGHISLSNDEKQTLDSLRFVWDVPSYERNRRLNALKAYKETHGDLFVPFSFKFSPDFPDVTLRGFKLGQSVKNIRSGTTSLSDNEKQILISQGFIWDLRAYERDRLMNALKAYKKTHGGLLVPRSFKFPPDYPDVTLRGFKLGQSVGNVRSGATSISDKTKQTLDSLGFVWDVPSYERDRLMNALKAYRETHGDLLVPTSFKFPSDYPDVTLRGFKLGQSVSCIRYRSIKISDNEKQTLDSLGFVWNPRSSRTS